MEYQEEQLQGQNDVKLPQETQLPHPGVVEETSHFCSLHLHV